MDIPVSMILFGIDCAADKIFVIVFSDVESGPFTALNGSTAHFLGITNSLP